MNVRIFVDGCRKKNGDGGWGGLIYHGEKITFFGGWAENTTNNIMELQGPIEAFRLIPSNAHKASMTSDSKYFVDGFNDWMHKWSKKDWTNGKKVVANVSKWQTLYEFYKLMSNTHAKGIEVGWVRGHDGHKENELCDKIANYCCKNKVRVLKTIDNNGRNLLGAYEISHLVSKEDKEKIHVGFDKDGYPINSFLITDEEGKIKVKDGSGLEEYLNDPFVVARRKKEGKKKPPYDMILVAFDHYKALVRNNIPHCA